MPYASDKQRKFFNANRKKLEAQGVNVDEWNESTKGKDIPEKAPMKKSAAAVLLTVLQLNNLKHAMDSMGLKPPTTMTPKSMTPAVSGKHPRPHMPLNPPTEPTNSPAAPPPKETAAAEKQMTPEQIAFEAGMKSGFKPTSSGSVLMPSSGQ